jgi:hypothetical protein
VTENAPRLARRNIAFQDVEIGAAYRGFLDPDDGIAGVFDLRHRTILQRFPAGTLIDECFHLSLLAESTAIPADADAKSLFDLG